MDKNHIKNVTIKAIKIKKWAMQMAFYLFPGLMFKRLSEIEEYNNARMAFNVYKISAQQYLGMGWFLQFIPGTKANIARRQLSTNLKTEIQAFLDNLDEFDDKSIVSSWFKKQAYRSSLSSYINLSPVFTLLDDLVSHLWPDIRENKKLSFEEIFSDLPIVNLLGVTENDNGREIYFKKDASKHIVHSILNPIRIIDNLVNFLHSLVNRLLEIGSQQGTPSSLPRAFLKGASGLFFGIIKIPVIILKHVIDFPLNIAHALIVSPVAHFMSSIQNAYQTRGQRVLIATTEELQNAKTLRRIAKGISHRPNTTLTNENNSWDDATQYIGIEKKELYQPNCSKTKVVAFRSREKKIDQTKSLISIFGFYRQHMISYPTAVNQAKGVLELAQEEPLGFGVGS